MGLNVGPRISRRAVLLAAGGLLVGCSQRPEADKVHLRLATGPAGAVYRRIGGALAKHISEHVPGASVTTVPSGASTDNIRMLRAGEVHLGLTSLDALIRTDGSGPEGSRRSAGSTTATCISWCWPTRRSTSSGTLRAGAYRSAPATRAPSSRRCGL
ncbi:hypothetical protein GCM10027614_80940 [Micromonospora vulcania]